MDYRKHEAGRVADQVRQACVWNARMMSLPTSYARLARAARLLDNIGVQASCHDQSAAGRGQSAGRVPDAGLDTVA